MKRLIVILLAAAVFPASVAAQEAERVVIRPGESTGPAWLGVRLGQTDDPVGVPILGVLRDSPAAKADIRAGDRLLRVDGKPVESLRDLVRVLRPHGDGDSVPVEVQRDGKRQTLNAKLVSQPDMEAVTRRHLVGHPAPPLAFAYAGDGTPSALADLRGKPTVLEFWATWCGPCRYVSKELAALKEQFGDQINIVGVSDEEMPVIRKHLERFPAHYAVASAVGDDLGEYLVQSLPMIVILDAEHRVAAVEFGRGHRAGVAAKLQTLLSEDRTTLSND